MSSSSSCSVPPSGADVDDDTSVVNRICVKIHKRLGNAYGVLTVADHRRAADAMLKVRDLVLANRSAMSAEAKARLLCAGISTSKRLFASCESDATQGQLDTTLTLLFVLLVLTEDCSDMHDDRFVPDQGAKVAAGEERPLRRVERADERLLAAWEASSLADSLSPHNATHASSWSQIVGSDASVSRAALREARYIGRDDAMDEFRRMALVFFRASINAAICASFGGAGCGHADFATLDSVGQLGRASEGRDEELVAIVEAAESESGQQVLRDMILSLKLPNSVVGVRRTLLLGREANAIATSNYTDLLNTAHEAAMCGVSWTWENDKDPTHRIAALLTGLAIATATSNAAIRKSDAFGGRVQLPFLECRPGEGDRLALVPGRNEWVVFCMRSGQPHVKLRAPGFDGLCECVVFFTNRRK